MTFVFDTETFPIRPGRQAPLVVCVQSRNGIELREQGLDTIEQVLKSDELIVGHNVAYDVLCSIASRPRLARLWLRAYESDRVTCTLEREKLIRIAQGTLSRYPKNGLIDLVYRYAIPDPYAFGVKDSKIRVNYHALDGIPVERWPQESIDYALADMVVEDVFEAQDLVAKPEWLRDEFRQARSALWLAATSASGMRVDPEAVRVFSDLMETEHRQVRELLTNPAEKALNTYLEHKSEDVVIRARELFDPLCAEPLVRPSGTKDTKTAKARMSTVCAQLGIPVPLTEKGQVSLDADACKTTSDALLTAYARFGSIGALRSRARRLRLAADMGIPIQPRFDNLKETGRTSASKGDAKPGTNYLAFGDQTQNLPREPGLRECYVARPGHVLLSSDWRAAELHALAQTCIDLGIGSQLASVLNSGIDVHTWFACRMSGWDYEWATSKERTPEEKKKIKRARQAAKACNFGFPGGLGIEKFQLFSLKQYGVSLSVADAHTSRNEWYAAFPEMRLYFKHISELIDSGAPLVHFKSGRYRGDLHYTSAANSYFQGRVADMLKAAGFRIMKEIWLGAPMRLWNEAHDEIMLEIPEDRSDELARRVVNIMNDAGREWCPDVPVKAEPALQRHWRKGAEAVYRDEKLIPWEDRDLTPSEVEKIKSWGGNTLHGSWIAGIEHERFKAIRCS